MSDTAPEHRDVTTVTMWFDPVCPFSWNTARWLTDVAAKTGTDIDWQLMNLAVLNEGRQLPPPQQARMHDSRQIGRLMTAITLELGVTGLGSAYFAFGERYFHGAAVDDTLVDHVLRHAGARRTTAAAVRDTSLDDMVRRSHQRAQDALGEPGGSPILRMEEHTFFGPVLTSLPDSGVAVALFDALTTLSAIPQFTQLQRPRPAE